jgi:hypothetical protein
MDTRRRAWMSGRLATIAAAALLIGGVLAISAPATAVAKPGKIRACVDKQGADKGAMRFVRKGKCKSGERKLSWNKRGKRGATGAAGAQGPQGQPGTGATDLLAVIEQQASAIETLQSQLAVLSAQMAAVCGQVATLTTRANALRSVIGGIGLDGVIPVGLLLDVPGLPPPLNAFACP